MKAWHAGSVNIIAILVAVAIVGIGCDGGNSSSTTPMVSSGTFLDSPVKGLEYKTATQSGLTEKDGAFKYIEGETVAFYIGSIYLGETAAKGVITPIDLVGGAVDETEPTVTNICRLLQSLDQDGNPDNGITITSETRQEAENRYLDFTLSVTDFENDADVQSLFNVLNALGILSIAEDRVLIPAERARSHLRVSLSQMGDGNDPIEIEGTDDNSPLHDRIITQRQWAYSEPSELNTLIAGVNSLAFDMYHQLQEDGKNLFLSPYAISRAMAMTLTGANGETAYQILESMKLPLDYDRLHSVFNALDLTLDPQRFSGEDHTDFLILDTEAAAWGQSGYFVPIDFYNSLAASYGATLQALDFQTQSFNADRRIDSWVARQTDDAFASAISLVTDRVRISLANTMKLNAEWARSFDSYYTVDGDFELISGSKVSVPMMSKTGEYLRVVDDGYEAIEIPFKSSSLAMLLILPEAGKYSDFEDTLDISVYQAILESLEQKSILLTIPRFAFSSGKNLVNALSQIGITRATVEGDADFSRINSADELYINGGLIKTSISVKEAGTQGASSAVITMEGKEDIPDYDGLFPAIFINPSGNVYDSGSFSVSVQAILPIESVALGRPFIFIIHDNSTGIILFIGRIMDPSKKGD